MGNSDSTLADGEARLFVRGPNVVVHPSLQMIHLLNDGGQIIIQFPNKTLQLSQATPASQKEESQEQTQRSVAQLQSQGLSYLQASEDSSTGVENRPEDGGFDGESSPLLRLPSVIRDIIWEYVLESRTATEEACIMGPASGFRHTAGVCNSPKQANELFAKVLRERHAILDVNRKIRHETSRFVAAAPIFYFCNISCLYRLVDRLGPWKRETIRLVQVKCERNDSLYDPEESFRKDGSYVAMSIEFKLQSTPENQWTPPTFRGDYMLMRRNFVPQSVLAERSRIEEEIRYNETLVSS